MGGKQTDSDSHAIERMVSLWRRRAAWLRGSLGQATLAIGFFLVAGTFAALMWGHFREQILSGKNYTVEAKRILIPTVPPWIRTDLKSEAMTSGSLENMHVQQKDLQRRVAAAFEMHPWVAEVRRVTTRFPGKVVVDLAYRRPIAMVAVDAVDPHTGELAPGVFPVDAEGTLLPPGGFTEEEATRFPHVVIDKKMPTVAPGSPWGDVRVHSAARIAQHLEKNWTRLRLNSIIAHPDHTGLTGPSTIYEIKTHDQTTIIWGHGPGEEESGEPKANRKIQRLLTFENQNGSLTVAPGEVIDLRQTDKLSVASREELDLLLQ